MTENNSSSTLCLYEVWNRTPSCLLVYAKSPYRAKKLAYYRSHVRDISNARVKPHKIPSSYPRNSFYSVHDQIMQSDQEGSVSDYPAQRGVIVGNKIFRYYSQIQIET